MRKVVHDVRQDVEKLSESNIYNLVNTAFLGKIMSVMASSNKIRVQPIAKRYYSDREGNRQYVDYSEVEINISSIKGFSSQLVTGDMGMIFIIQNDISKELNGEKESERRYDILDGIFMPMIFGNANTTEVIISTNSHLKIENSTHDLLVVLKQLSTDLKALTVNTQTGVLNPPSQTAMTAAETAIGTFIA